MQIPNELREDDVARCYRRKRSWIECCKLIRVFILPFCIVQGIIVCWILPNRTSAVAAALAPLLVMVVPVLHGLLRNRWIFSKKRSF